ncbi:MAG: hypothetical protein AABO41_17095 [Acidobacteriota bacterium]
MNTRQLSEAILDGGIRSNNFFNGRLLSAEDLSSEQQANRAGNQALGQAIGDGIAYGLEVSKANQAGNDPIVSVQPGLAINRYGDALRLNTETVVSLVRPAEALNLPVTAQAGFNACQPLQSGSYVTGAGVYLLVLCPAQGREGRALIGGLNNTASGCNTKFIVDGVKFRLIQLDLTPAELNDADHLRNAVAYKCFGVADMKSLVSDPFRAGAEGYGLLDQLRPSRLTDCDVPLAVLNWTASGGIRFVDMWSGRRPTVRASVDGRWNGILGDRRASEAEAMFLQFADQLDALRTVNPEAVVASQYFRYLPPVGVLPLARPGAVRGFKYSKFFEQRVYREPIFIEGSRVEALIRRGMSHAPIDLNNGEMVWLYAVRETYDPRAYSPAPVPFEYVIFASGHIPYHGEALFNVARWNYSNYS